MVLVPAIGGIAVGHFSIGGQIKLNITTAAQFTNAPCLLPRKRQR